MDESIRRALSNRSPPQFQLLQYVHMKMFFARLIGSYTEPPVETCACHQVDRYQYDRKHK